jgi:hypothetical protein
MSAASSVAHRLLGHNTARSRKEDSVKRLFQTVSPAVIGLTVLFAAPEAEPGQYGTYCRINSLGQLRERHVYGQVTAECNSCFGHTGPFGNWGVGSLFSPPQDGTQFKGWAPYDYACGGNLNPPQWNSCTTDHPPPNQYRYNWPPGEYTSQYSPDVTIIGETHDWYSTDEELGCSFLDGLQYPTGATISIWELDEPDSDEFIASVDFPVTFVTLSCTRGGCESVASPWVNGANDVLSVDFRAVVNVCLNVEGKGGC